VAAPFQNAEASCVALRRQPFGEGKERFAYQFFELASDGETVVGEPLVAKLCKIDPTERKRQNPREYWEWADRFVKRFCRLHHYASIVANAFNQKLDSIRLLDPDTARVEFVRCSVYYLRDENNTTGANNTENNTDTTDIRNATDEEEYAVIVEPRLFGKFQKWNSNAGVRKWSRFVSMYWIMGQYAPN
jgi:Alpha-kinase family